MPRRHGDSFRVTNHTISVHARRVQGQWGRYGGLSSELERGSLSMGTSLHSSASELTSYTFCLTCCGRFEAGSLFLLVPATAASRGGSTALPQSLSRRLQAQAPDSPISSLPGWGGQGLGGARSRG